jgi:hypothetical protein
MDERILEAARVIRPYLAGLVGIEAAAAVDAELAEILARAAAGEDVETALLTVLKADDATSVFLDRVLDDPLLRPPGVVPEVTKGYSPLPTPEPPPVPADKFHCPYGDYVWYRPEVGVPIKHCLTHQCPLEPG